MASFSAHDDDDTLTGTSSADELTIYADDVLAIGGYGDDVYTIMGDGAKIQELAGEGWDKVKLWIEPGEHFQMPENVEEASVTALRTYNWDLDLFSSDLDVTDGESGWDHDLDPAAALETGVRITGNGLDNRIGGSDRSDLLRGGEGDDTLIGGLGADTLEGGEGGDRLDGGAHDDLMRGGRGGDVYIVNSAGDRVEEKGGDGAVDHVDTTLATFDLRLHAEIEGLHFKTGASCYGFGNALDNIIGSDGGNDTVLGFGGNDVISLGGGRNSGYGGTGNDTISTEGNGGSVLSGDDGNDLLSTMGAEGRNWVYGGNGDDTIEGGIGPDRLYGDAGNDLISANVAQDYYYGYVSGDVEMHGGAGSDTLYGSFGDDTLTGGAGRDTLWGSGGEDVFRYEALTDSRSGAMDTILEFVSGKDRIDLSALDADATMAGNQAFAFTGHGAMFQSAGDLWVRSNLMGCTVQADVNGDGMSDFAVAIRGEFTLTAADFIL